MCGRFGAVKAEASDRIMIAGRGPHQHQRRSIVVCGSRRYELTSRLQNGHAQFARAVRSRMLKALLHHVQSEFRSLVIRVDVIPFDDSAGDNRKSRAEHKVTASRALHRVREQSQRSPVTSSGVIPVLSRSGPGPHWHSTPSPSFRCNNR
jgi:hypothetical protein